MNVHNPDAVYCDDGCGRFMFDLGEPGSAFWPCPHFVRICEDCWPNACRECEEHAELAQRIAAGPPPHDLGPAKTLTEIAAEQQAHLEWRQWVSSFDPITNTYQPRRKK